ncbi:PTS mannitol transporter subunit IICBA [Camelliibacillus cellulosilyticus]|uniref:Mannitol-specific phosphotransferase enzyme IIA component n=1 Tax=Camelliibacillus cellulosilyticus TaxID=2174486 RepID=A0ABV9GS95_9BACL
MPNSKGVKVGVQKFGNFLSSMVLPNIGAFIAWGLITALFIPTGWVPNATLAKIGDPMVTYLLPLLIGFTGGKLVHDHRGGVVGAIATMGVIVGTDIPMFLGAMIMGPLGGYVIKKFDGLIEGKIKTGFEMLINNFSAGILGGILAVISYLVIGPAVDVVSGWLGDVVEWMVRLNILPLTSIFIEPAKVLFLNNAINHGVLTPLGLEQAKEAGKSVLFLLEANPGPGIGMLLAYCFFGKGMAKRSAPGAAVIQFFGGIHEIYFPYILMRPMLFIAVILGGISGVFTLVILHGGLLAPASPGSIIAVLLETPRGVGTYVANILGVLIAAAVSFIVSSIILKTGKGKEDNIEEATKKMEEMKGKKSSVASILESGNAGSFDPSAVTQVIFACDAGMGSSAMGASILRKKMKEAGVNVKVTNTAISNLTGDAQVVVTQEELTPRAKQKAPGAYHVSVDNFMASPEYDQLVKLLKSGRKDTTAPVEEEEPEGEANVLTEENIFLNQSFENKEAAIRFAGEALVKGGYVREAYIDAMLERERDMSTYMGNEVAIPHGTEQAKKDVLKSGVVIVQVPEGVDFGGQRARLIFGIAGKDGGHLKILSSIATACTEMDNVEKMVQAKDKDELMAVMSTTFE